VRCDTPWVIADPRARIYTAFVRLSRPLLAVCGFLAVLSVGGCRERLLDSQSDVVIVNSSRCQVTIAVDGWEACSVVSDSARTVDNVGSGRHILEAKDDLGRLIERRYIDLRRGEDYYWRLDTCPQR